MKNERAKKIVEYAKIIKNKCHSRKELVKKTADYFSLSTNTINMYFVFAGFKTKFPFGLKTYWDKVKSGEIKKPPVVSLQILKLIEQKTPRSALELDKLGYHVASFYKVLRRHGFPIRRIKILNQTFYYLESQKLEVYDYIKKHFYKQVYRNKRNILHALNIKFTPRRGRYKIIEDGLA